MVKSSKKVIQLQPAEIYYQIKKYLKFRSADDLLRQNYNVLCKDYNFISIIRLCTKHKREIMQQVLFRSITKQMFGIAKLILHITQQGNSLSYIDYVFSCACEHGQFYFAKYVENTYKTVDSLCISSHVTCLCKHNDYILKEWCGELILFHLEKHIVENNEEEYYGYFVIGCELHHDVIISKLFEHEYIEKNHNTLKLALQYEYISCADIIYEHIYKPTKHMHNCYNSFSTFLTIAIENDSPKIVKWVLNKNPHANIFGRYLYDPYAYDFIYGLNSRSYYDDVYYTDSRILLCTKPQLIFKILLFQKKLCLAKFFLDTQGDLLINIGSIITPQINAEIKHFLNMYAPYTFDLQNNTVYVSGYNSNYERHEIYNRFPQLTNQEIKNLKWKNRKIILMLALSNRENLLKQLPMDLVGVITMHI